MDLSNFSLFPYEKTHRETIEPAIEHFKETLGEYGIEVKSESLNYFPHGFQTVESNRDRFSKILYGMLLNSEFDGKFTNIPKGNWVSVSKDFFDVLIHLHEGTTYFHIVYKMAWGEFLGKTPKLLFEKKVEQYMKPIEFGYVTETIPTFECSSNKISAQLNHFFVEYLKFYKLHTKG